MSNRRTQVITAIPLVLVNTVAVLGQFAYLRDHLGWPPIGVGIFAGAIESIALLLAYMAHKSLMSLDSSMRLRLGALAFGFLAGYMNATHYMHDGHLTFVSIATGLMSASSPVLWGIYSRRQSRDELMARGLIEPGAVRLGFNRWLMYPVRSFRVYRAAAWHGIREPAQAISEYEAAETAREILKAASEPESEPERDMERDGIETAQSKAQAVTVALTVLGDSASAPDVTAWLAARNWTVTPAYVRQIRSRNTRKAVETQRDSIRALPSATGTS